MVSRFLAFANPNDTGPLEIVDDSEVLVPLLVGNLIDPDALEPSYSMPITNTLDGPVQEVGER